MVFYSFFPFPRIKIESSKIDGSKPINGLIPENHEHKDYPWHVKICDSRKEFSTANNFAIGDWIIFNIVSINANIEIKVMKKIYIYSEAPWHDINNNLLSELNNWTKT